MSGRARDDEAPESASQRRLLSNVGRLLSANVVGSALSLLAMMLTARGLGPAGYGMVTLVLAYCLVITRLTSFNSCQSVIRFGAEAREKGNVGLLRRLIKGGFRLDLLCALASTMLHSFSLDRW
jgi:O-antigen/teichoic acid export membrane protein